MEKGCRQRQRGGGARGGGGGEADGEGDHQPGSISRPWYPHPHPHPRPRYLAQAHRSRPSLTLYTLARRIRRGAASWPRAAPSHAASPHPYTRFIQPNYCILYTAQRKTTFTEHTFLQHHKFLFLAYFSQFNCSRKLSFQQTHSRTHLKASVRFSPSFVVLFRDDYPMTQLAPTY